MDYSRYELLNRVNISGVDIYDPVVNVFLIYARSGENRDPQRCRVHKHAHFEIHYVAQGKMKYEIEDCFCEISEGRYILITPNQKHRVIDHSDDYVKFSVAFEVDIESEIYKVLNNKRKKVYEITPYISSGFAFLLKQAERHSSFSAILVKKRLNEMVYYIADRVSNGKMHRIDKEFSDDRLLKAIRYIEDNSNVFFSCNEVAEYCGISAKQLGRLFLKYRGESMLEFIHVQKISDARKMLVNTDELQETIAKNLGFSSVHYFNKFFLHEVGMTPDDYRKKHGKVNNGRNKK